MLVTITFTPELITPPPLSASMRETGACVEFQGIVRQKEGERLLEGLDYEAYEPMARRLLERHCAELTEGLEVHEIVFIHRLGHVPVGKASLFVRVLSKHRGPALRVCGELIERLKADVPIWKVAR